MTSAKSAPNEDLTTQLVLCLGREWERKNPKKALAYFDLIPRTSSASVDSRARAAFLFIHQDGEE